MKSVIVGLTVLALGSPVALADDGTTHETTGETAPASQVIADVGLSVVLVGYERALTDHVSLAVGAGIFGTYFLPWFDLGEDVTGLAIGVRPTWFAQRDRRGLYVAPYLRGVGVRGDAVGVAGDGVGFTAGAFVGWAFGLTDRLDLRVGAGAQYLYFEVESAAGRDTTSTPFVGLDAVVGYRL